MLPQQEIKLKSCLAKPKFFLPILIIFTEASNDSGLLELGMPFLKKKLIIRILYICCGSKVNMCNSKQVFPFD